MFKLSCFINILLSNYLWSTHCVPSTSLSIRDTHFGIKQTNSKHLSSHGVYSLVACKCGKWKEHNSTKVGKKTKPDLNWGISKKYLLRKCFVQRSEVWVGANRVRLESGGEKWVLQAEGGVVLKEPWWAWGIIEGQCGYNFEGEMKNGKK